ncbi:RNA polymerase sigma-70 factor [Kineobactrum salinum]|uniref:RNA polymerase sigma-70 factor n=1 Tax=Kineobactrum salinum TaxID=2708301 RepID=A0A6C0TYP8_9GAMM|nr:RNA polymerase sigma-70 factor [Kineobactrum salinum]QIB64896.1 RNA polymerase sigma-70 factor [Kineobactrum salinum]
MADKEALYQQARPRLFGLAYRLLGSRVDAEDLVQDAWFKWRAADESLVHDAEAWLVTVVTRLGIDRQRQAKARRETYLGPWLPEPLLDEPPLDGEALMILAADLSMAFLVALERLGPEERAAFLLREVFDYSYNDIAAVLGKSEMACRQLISRARKRVRDDRVRYPVREDRQRQLATQFAEALMSEDREGFTRLLAREVEWVSDGGGKARAASRPITGVRATTRLAMGLVRRWRGKLQVQVATINGQSGVLLCVERRILSAWALETDGRQVCSIYSVVNPDKLRSLKRAPVINLPIG